MVYTEDSGQDTVDAWTRREFAGNTARQTLQRARTCISLAVVIIDDILKECLSGALVELVLLQPTCEGELVVVSEGRTLLGGGKLANCCRCKDV